MSKTKTLLIAVFVAVALGIGVTASVLINQPKAPVNDTTVSGNAQGGNQTASDGQQNENLVSFVAEADKTVLDQLKTKAEVVTKDSSFGVYVDSINGKVGGTDGKYWAYYVDGQMAQVGAGEYVTKGGETVEWKFE